MNELPHSRCNFIASDSLICVGASPIHETFQNILNWNPSLIINLEDIESWYYPHLPQNIKYITLPIKNGDIPSIDSILPLMEEMNEFYRNQRKIYIHCAGGHGRAGLIATLFIGYMSGMDTYEAISYIESWRNTRLDTSRNFVPTPETNKQVQFIHHFLKLKPGHTLPDRSDRSWLTRVRNERRKR